jgi:hypothetical protein
VVRVEVRVSVRCREFNVPRIYHNDKFGRV